MTAKSHAKTVSLVLGSGGARGYAHIGVIQWLLENGYEIKSIAGSSIGALVGGIYATGKLERYSKWVSALEKIDVLRLLDPALNRAGLIKGDRIMEQLRKLIGDINIEELPISFVAVATDFQSGKEVWLRRGDLFDAIRGSIAIPMVFTPFKVGGRYLIDGGIVNPVPIAPTLNDHTDLTVVVGLSGHEESQLAHPATVPQHSPKPKPASPANPYRQRILGFLENLAPAAVTARVRPPFGMVDVALRAMDTMEVAITRFKLAAYSPDVVIEIPHNACQLHEFWRAEELISLGKARAARAFSRQQVDHDPDYGHDGPPGKTGKAV
ncbi:patatin-like phospholipase family protein [Janthinobacterium sp. 17J80-10]|uniref:patatin-like phospholipase family protein n=1 Tax=Janthinobacterium sp. 17J80-10 TaxID=2497863 RepID=UPI001005796D|nr:patatin-like phospholipase family protein [Janthinobacterium sp. 17J80-10]QAU34144.1 serine protease [Janthinobacterium sp. 17J80-10]